MDEDRSHLPHYTSRKLDRVMSSDASGGGVDQQRHHDGARNGDGTSPLQLKLSTHAPSSSLV